MKRITSLLLILLLLLFVSCSNSTTELFDIESIIEESISITNGQVESLQYVDTEETIYRSLLFDQTTIFDSATNTYYVKNNIPSNQASIIQKQMDGSWLHYTGNYPVHLPESVYEALYYSLLNSYAIEQATKNNEYFFIEHRTYQSQYMKLKVNTNGYIIQALHCTTFNEEETCLYGYRYSNINNIALNLPSYNEGTIVDVVIDQLSKHYSIIKQSDSFYKIETNNLILHLYINQNISRIETTFDDLQFVIYDDNTIEKITDSTTEIISITTLDSYLPITSKIILEFTDALRDINTTLNPK